MSNVSVESLTLEVNSSSASAQSGIDALTTSLTKLKNAAKGGANLTTTVNQLNKLNTALSTLNSGNISKITSLSTALSSLSSISNLTVPTSLGTNLTKLATAANSLSTTDMNGITRLTTALSSLTSLSGLSGTGLSSMISALSKLPNVATQLNTVDWANLTSQLTALSNALTPLATQLTTVSSAVSSLPTQLTSLATSAAEASTALTSVGTSSTSAAAGEETMAAATTTLSTSFGTLMAKISASMTVIYLLSKLLATCINESTEYTEMMNMFTVSLGDYAQAAYEYAETVSDALGINISEWIEAEGTINSIITGFGVAADEAYVMSENLTQLAYDLSSFYDISVENAILKVQSGISGELEPLRRLGYDLSVARLQQEALNLGIEKSVSNMTQAEKAELRYYAMMTQVTQVQGDMARTLTSPANQLRVLKAQLVMCAKAIGNLFIPMLNAILPYAIAVVKVLRLLCETIADLLGITYSEVDWSSLTSGSSSVSDLTDDADDASSALSDAADAAEELKNATLGIDELNIISDEDTSSSSSSSDSGDSDTSSSGLGIDLPTYDFLSNLIDTQVDNIVSAITDALSVIQDVVGGFMLAIGVILVLTGHTALGIALIIAGIGVLGISAANVNWDALSDPVATTLATILAIVGGALLAVGIILTLTGFTAVGIALMIAGAASIISAVAIDWNCLEGNIQSVIATIAAAAGAALLVLGVILAFCGAGTTLALGIALIAAGAALLVTSVALNWDSLGSTLQEKIANIAAIAGAASLALGVILVFTGVATGIGFALIALGAAALVTAAIVNWSSLDSDTKQALADIASIAGACMLALGVILTFTGVATALGIALIAAGAITLGVSAVALNWNSMSTEVQNALTAILTIVGTALLAIGAILTLSMAAPLVGMALMAAGAAALVTSLVANWDSITSTISGVLSAILVVVGGALLVVGIILTLAVPAAMMVGLGLIAAGVGVLGVSAVTLNWNNMGSQIQTVLSAILAIAGAALLALGIILTLTGVGTMLGIALIAAGAASLVATTALNWDSIRETIQNVLETIVNVVKKVGLLALGVILCLTGVGIPLGITLIKEAISGEYSESVIDWNSIGETVKQKLSDIVEGAKEVIGDGIDIVINLAKNAWTTVTGWVSSAAQWGASVLEAAVSLIKSGWSTISSFVGTAVTTYITLAKKSWSTISSFVGTAVTTYITLAKKSWSTISSFVGTAVTTYITLAKKSWSTISSFVGTAVSVATKLTKKNWSTISSFVGTTVSVGIKLVKSGWSTLKSFFGLSSGGTVAASGAVKIVDPDTASGGGIFGRSIWKALPKYAGGTSSAHGSMFVAGEDGAELVGHVNGTTEVLNRFQLAQVMKYAIVSGMAQYTQIWSAMLSQMTACANGIINAVCVTSDSMQGQLVLATANGASAMNMLSQTVYTEGQQNNDNSYNEDWVEGMYRFYTQYVAPTVNEMASDVKRQADKEEKTVVNLNGRTITTAVERQQKANGYSFMI